MIGYTITSGTPTPQEKAVLELALKQHERSEVTVTMRSAWAAPQLRAPLVRKG